MNELSSKRALVTGAATSVGRDIAVELVRRGARGVVHYANSDRDAYETAQAIKGSRLRACALVQADLRTVSECNRAVEEAAEALGGLGVSVNNAGVRHARSFLDTNEEVSDAVFDLNVKGCLFCTNRAVPFMLQAGAGTM